MTTTTTDNPGHDNPGGLHRPVEGVTTRDDEADETLMQAETARLADEADIPF